MSIIDTATAKVITVLEGHTDDVASAAFSPDGHLLVTAANDSVRLWTVFPSTQDLIDDTRRLVPRCLTIQQRVGAHIDREPPVWCIEMEKWPYHAQDWKDWLRFKRANANPPLPDTPEWDQWVASHRAN